MEQVKILEDPLGHLPCSSLIEYKKGKVVYTKDQPANRLYLIIDGRVKVWREAKNGRRVVTGIYQCDDFFGDLAYLGLPNWGDEAITLEPTKIMLWEENEVEEIIRHRPKLGIALLQILAQHISDWLKQIESLAADSVSRRLARALVLFSERFGIQEEDGSISIKSFSHGLLGEYIGMSSKTVTRCMNDFRRQGYVKYSRQEIVIYCEAMREWLQQNA